MRVFFLLAGALTAFGLQTGAYAHGGAVFDAGTNVNATLVINYRDESMVASSDGQLLPWYVSGAMMGGEALPYEEGIIVDEASLSIFHMSENGVYGNLKLMSHHQESAELEHAYVGLHLLPEATKAPLRIEAGRMAGLFSPENPLHGSDRLMTESPLALDVFLGRQFNDDGVRLLWGSLARGSGFLLGAEIWRGDAFPASAAQGGEAYDIFARYHYRVTDWDFTLGGWAMDANAEGRTDNRYDSSHNHGVDASDIPAYTFDGDSELTGINVAVRWRASENLSLALRSEWYWLTLTGIIADETRSADIESDADGGWLQLELGYSMHTLGLRYETLVFENHFIGAGGEPLANDLSLNNQGFEPKRTTLGYRYQLRPQIQLRAEWVRDDTQEDDSELGDRFVLGVVWKQELWSN
ncbi:MAG: hypothetical protein MI976_07165 [Pseudomonadales bacterium]|nr:hypothetical protein [Pseudomonadales bacterium]